MNDIQLLINLNIEIEGLLRVLRERDDVDARRRLNDKFEEYSELMMQYMSEYYDDEPEYTYNEPEEEPTEPEPETEPAPAVVEEAAPEVVLMPETEVVVMNEAAPRSTSLMKAFTLNDRFRFCRELFGDEDDFTETLHLLADMESYREAEDYLINDMLWNRDNPAVADFLDILSKNMPDEQR